VNRVNAWMKRSQARKVQRELQPPALATRSAWRKLAVCSIVESLLP
jgi:hypothetical protein